MTGEGEGERAIAQFREPYGASPSQEGKREMEQDPVIVLTQRCRASHGLSSMLKPVAGEIIAE